MNRPLAGSLLGALLLLTFSPAAPASDEWPQWRGPDRSGAAPLFEPPGTWPAELQLVWEVEVGQGDSSPLVSGGQVFLFTRSGDMEVVRAFALEDGSRSWESSYPAPFKPLDMVGEHGAGPYSTPLVAGGRLFTLGISGIVSAFDVETGKQIWQREFSGDFKRSRPFYGASQAPLAVDDRLIVHVGGPGDGALTAFDQASGRTLWQWKGDGPAYGAPIVAEVDGVRQLVTFTQRHLVGVDFESGRLLWQEPFRLNFDVTSITPTIYQDLVIVSGYDVATRAYRPHQKEGSWSVEEMWSNSEVSMQFSSPVLAGGRLYGFSHKNKGQLVALDPATGATLWQGEARQGENAWLMVTGVLLAVVKLDGEMEVFSTEGEDLAPLATYTVADSAVWAHPALFDRFLLTKDADTLRLWEVLPD